MNRTGLGALLSHWRRRPFQLFTLIMGLALATALWTGVQAINAQARQSYDAASAALGADQLDDLIAANGTTIPIETYVALRRSGWLVSPVIEGWISGPNGRIRLVGIDPVTAPEREIGPVAAMLRDQSFENTQGPPLIANEETFARLDPAIDVERVTLPDMAFGLVITDISQAVELLEQDGLSRLIVLPDQPLNQPALSEIASNLERRSPQMQADISRLTDSFHLNLTAFGLLSFAVGLFIVHGAIGLAFEQRRSMFRTLRSIGLSARRLVLLAAGELFVLALIAGIFGVFLGYLLSAALLPDVAATLGGLYGAEVSGSLNLKPIWWIAGLGISLVGSAIAAASSLIKLARLSPLAPAQPRAWARASRKIRFLQLGAAGALCLIAFTLVQFGTGLIAGFILLGSVLLSAALALPAALDAGLFLLARLSPNGPVRDWFWADTRQQLPGLSMALMALLLALATNIGVSTMVSSFRFTFLGWIDQVLASDIYLRTEDEAQTQALLNYVEKKDLRLLPNLREDGRAFGAPASFRGVVEDESYQQSWPLLAQSDNVWERFFIGEVVLINEQLAYGRDIGVGDILPLTQGDRLVGGIYSDYGNPAPEIMINAEGFADIFGQVETREFGLIANGRDLEVIKQNLIETVGLQPRSMADQAVLRSASVSIFERTFAVTGALNVLTLAIAGFAIFTSLLTLSAMRLPQLAPLWAIGMTRRALARLEVLRALLLAILTFLFALPLGLLLAWLLLAVINVEAFGWRLPMQLFPRDWLFLAFASLLAVFLATLWPARRLAHLTPARLIAIFANER